MGFHSLSFRTFCQATEDDAKVIQALKFASGAEDVERTVSEGYHGNKITVLTAWVRRKKQIDTFFSKLGRDDLLSLSETLDKRVDEDGDLFLRLDKQKAFLGELKVLDGEDVISVRGSVKAYPKRRDIVLAVVEEYLRALLDRGPSGP